MDFGEQIKSIRRTEGLTQEQFAGRLHVSRQAVSNWENNRNLPDIEMLIQMSNEFQVSLDQLIKGDQEANNMTEKVIRDGSETRRARYNMIVAVIGAVLLLLTADGFFPALLGMLLLALKALSVEYVDDAGFLHENFFLLPAGFLCLGCGMVAFLSMGIRALCARVKMRCSRR